MSDTLQNNETLEALRALRDRARTHLSDLTDNGRRVSKHQAAAHAFAYFETELLGCEQLEHWAAKHGPVEAAISRAYITEFTHSLSAGIRLGAGEFVSIEALGLSPLDCEAARATTSGWGSTSAQYAKIGALDSSQQGAFGLDETEEAIRTQFARFTEERVTPIAMDIHRDDVLIPMQLLNDMAELGVFGLTIDEAYDGLGMNKVAMCIVTEELSRGYIGVGSLGTRAEIAAELILGSGTDAQKAEWLPKIASGEILPTAVFTEPNFGSDLAHLATRATLVGDRYELTGQKTWITHAVRADLMTVLARTNPDEPGYAGLSILLAPKTRVEDEHAEPFPDAGIEGSEIPVLGYRGMKEYELSFDRYGVPKDNLLGAMPGEGFKQLMRTFESARIQTAARGVGVARAALEGSIRYANERNQFGRSIGAFERVATKIGRGIAAIQASRQLTYHAARRKDEGERCDLEAGMAKLLATRTAWETADTNVQIHGGNGYAEEYEASRLLVDARVLSIFEGANEIQAQVVARRLLETNES